MSEYYTPPDDIVMFTKVKASQLNDLKDSVDIGFDNLPTDLSGLKQEVIDAREDKPTLLSRLQAAEASTAADVITCQSEVINCQSEVVNCQSEVVNCQAEVVNCQAKVVLCQAEFVNCTTEVSNCQAEVVNCQTEVVNCQEQVDIMEAYIESLIFVPVSSQSTTPLTVGNGAKTLNVGTDIPFSESMWLVIIDRTNPENHMKGYVTSYTSTTGSLTIAIVKSQGIGESSSDWLVAQTTPAVASDYSPVSFKGLVMAEMF